MLPNTGVTLGCSLFDGCIPVGALMSALIIAGKGTVQYMIQEAVKNINLLDTGYVFILNLRIYCVISNEKAKDKQP